MNGVGVGCGGYFLCLCVLCACDLLIVLHEWVVHVCVCVACFLFCVLTCEEEVLGLRVTPIDSDQDKVKRQ